MQPINYINIGVTSDLSRKKLIRAAFELWQEKKIAHFIGIGRKELSNDDFKRLIVKGLDSPTTEEVSSFLTASFYFQLNYQDPASYQELMRFLTEKADGDWIFHLSLPPDQFLPTLQQMNKAGLASSPSGNASIILEKPFGFDATSASSLLEAIEDLFPVEMLFLIDHYLGKESVRNLLPLRKKTKQLWNNQFIGSIEIIAFESEGIGDRGAYYDKTGVIRDMIQSHCLEVLSMIAMDIPSEDSAEPLRQARIDLFQSIIIKSVQTGQYEDYTQEANVVPNSLTETFAALKIQIDNENWTGIPFTISSGKRLKEKKSEIIVTFKSDVLAHLAPILKNELPALVYNSSSHALKIVLDLPTYRDNAYSLLINDCIQNDHTYFIREDEVVAAWQAVKPALQYTKQHRPLVYQVDSWGPK